MDFVHTIPPNQAAPTPAPVILARNIQKFFKEKSERMRKGNGPGGASSNGSGSSDLDVNTVLHDVDSILDGRSVEDGRLLLRGMVADLLREVDLLRWRLDETSASLQRVKEERDVVNNDYRDQLLSLMLALQNAVGGGDYDNDILQERSQLQNGHLLTADEATALTIHTLTRKIETLNLEAATMQQQLTAARERTEDLESENAAKVHKIAALEKQFQSINKKRHKVVVHKQQQQQLLLNDKTNDSVNSSTAASAGGATVGSSNNHHNNASFNHSISSKPKRKGHVARLVKLVDEI